MALPRGVGVDGLKSRLKRTVTSVHGNAERPGRFEGHRLVGGKVHGFVRVRVCSDTLRACTGREGSEVPKHDFFRGPRPRRFGQTGCRGTCPRRAGAPRALRRCLSQNRIRALNICQMCLMTAAETVRRWRGTPVVSCMFPKMATLLVMPSIKQQVTVVSICCQCLPLLV